MTRKVARQSETTPIKTIDEYLWSARLGIAQLPDINPGATQSPTSSLPPDPSAAPALDFDANMGTPSDMFGSGVSGGGQLIAPPPPNTTPASVPAIGKAGAVSTLYGDVNPTPTIGESSSPPDNNGSQSNRNNSSENLPNGPDSGSPISPAAMGEEEGGAGLAADLGEAASVAALASKHWVGSVLDPVYANNEDEDEDDYLFDSGIDPDEVLDAYERGIDIENYVNARGDGATHNEILDAHGEKDLTEARVHQLPKCSFCDNKASYDFKTKHGPWGYGCESCYNEHKVPGSGLGTGKGQRLIVSDEPTDPKKASMNWESRYAGKKKDHYKYIKKRGDKFVIIQKGTGKVLSTHDSKEKAISAFKAMEMHLHG